MSSRTYRLTRRGARVVTVVAFGAAILIGVEAAARAAEKAGARVREMEMPPLLVDAHAAHGPLQNYEAARSLAFEYDQHHAQLPPLLRAWGGR